MNADAATNNNSAGDGSTGGSHEGGRKPIAKPRKVAPPTGGAARPAFKGKPSKPGTKPIGGKFTGKPFTKTTKPAFGNGKPGGAFAKPRRDDAPAHAAGQIAPGARIVFEDDEVLVIEKPAGMITAAGPEETRPTLFDAVKQHVRGQAGRSRSRQRQRDEADATGDANRRGKTFAGIIHRLDREASGLLVFSKTERAYHWLKDDFKSKRVHRLYVALVEGDFGKVGDSGTIQSFLREARTGSVKSIKSDQFRGGGGGLTGYGEEHDQARPAVTHYRVLGVGGGCTLLQIRLETGRKHQIRVHMMEKGHPIVGDHIYGSKNDPLRRLGLHAVELGFNHPATGQSARFSSVAPAGFYTTVGLQVPKQPGPPSVTPAPKATRSASDTSWDNVAGWYDELLDEKRSDHYDNVIIPGTLRLVQPTAGMRVLDLACGQGIISRELARLGADVLGVDASEGLLQAARARAQETGAGGQEFRLCDATRLGELALPPATFDACACIMALSNINPLEPAIRSVAEALKPGGRFTFIITHPAFRALDQTSWGWEGEKVQFRRVDGYLSPGQKAVKMHPGAAPDVTTWTFHRPLQTYVRTLSECGLLIDALEEWPAARVSQPGPRAEAENRARREIPLFLAVRATKR